MCVCLQWCTHNGQTVFLSGMDKLDVVLYTIKRKFLRLERRWWQRRQLRFQETSSRGSSTLTRKCVCVLCVFTSLLSCHDVVVQFVHFEKTWVSMLYNKVGGKRNWKRRYLKSKISSGSKGSQRMAC